VGVEDRGVDVLIAGPGPRRRDRRRGCQPIRTPPWRRQWAIRQRTDMPCRIRTRALPS